MSAIFAAGTVQDPSIMGMLSTPWFWTSLLDGLKATLYISAWAIVLSFAFGIIVGTLRYSRIPVISWIAAAYVELIRNVPLVLLMLMCFFLGRMVDVRAAILALTIFTTAIIAEVVRGGLNSIPRGQWEAAKSQGMSYVQILRYIVLPQAVTAMIPPIVSQFVTVTKDSSFAWQLGYIELVARSRILQGIFPNVYQILVIYGVVALFYFTINYALSQSSRMLQRKLTAGRGSIGS